MNCLKCGQEIPFGRVFCESCLTEMERYPVKPDTVVQLPPKPKEQPAKKQSPRRRSALSPEEQVKQLRTRCRLLAAALIAALALAAVMFFVNGTLLEKITQLNPLGKNYSTVVSTQPSSMVPSGAGK